MIPTKTLRERMREALERTAGTVIEGDDLERVAEACIQAIGDPCLIKTADSLEPTFTLRAQDRSAAILVRAWSALAFEHGCDSKKVDEAGEWAWRARFWENRKWPD